MPTRVSGNPGLAFVTAIAAIRGHVATACQMILLAAMGVAFIGPVLSFFSPLNDSGTTLRFESVRSFGYDLGWTGAAVMPGAAQQGAVRELTELLVVAAVLTLFVLVCSLLLTASSNSGERASELAIHRAVGASRRTLLSAAVAESGLMAGIALLGGGLAAASLSSAARGSWPGSTVGSGLGLAAPVLLVATALLFSCLLPILHRARRRLTGQVREPPGLLLPALQLGLALSVLYAAALISDAAERMAEPASGPRMNRIVLSAAPAPDTIAERAAGYERVIAALDSVPGIDAVSLASPGQLIGHGTVDFLKADCGACPRGGILLPWLELNATVQMVSSDTFRALGFEIVSGRAFKPSDRGGGEPVAVVNRYLAGRYFEDGRAVGRDLYVGADHGRARHRVVGVVDDARSRAFGGKSLPLETVYLSVLQHPPTAAEIVLAGRPQASIEAVADLASRTLGSPVHVSSQSRRLEREAEPGRWFARWFGIEGWAMLAGAMLGISAFMRRWMVALAPEIALRRATGASRRRMALHIGARIAALGLGGTAVGLVFFGPTLWSAVAANLPGASAWAPGTLARFASLLVGAAFAGAAIPAWHVLRLPPARYLIVE